MAIESDHEEINLNDEQKFVVEDEDIKFLSVQAGPGSGKTRVLVEKVKHMVNELRVEPETFLIITFAEKAAEELRDRLIEGDIPASAVQKMQISTIHSFCLKVLEEAGEVGLDVVEDGDKQHLFIKKHLEDDLEFGADLNIGNYDIDQMIEKFDEYSTFQVKTDELVEYLEENFEIDPDYVKFVHEEMEKNGEFPTDEVKKKKKFKDSHRNAKYIQIAKSYPKYLELLKKEHAIDFNQMQFWALDKLTEEFLDRIYPKYTNILIDEFQDTDPVQMEIFKKFIDYPKINSVTVVGDLNQSIYGFRGSNKDYFKELNKLYPNKFEEVFLSTNYRSTEEIIDLSQDFISPHYKSPKKLTRAKCGRREMEEKEVHNDVYFMVSEVGDPKDEGTFGDIEAENLLKVIQYIKDDEEMNLSDIAILSRSVKRNNSSCFKTLIRLLDENNIKYQLIGIGDLAESGEVRYLLTLIYHLIQEDNPYYTFVPKETAEWLNLKTLTGANGNKVLFELSEETKEKLNEQQEKFEQAVIDEDGCVFKEINPKGKPIEKFSKIFEKERKRQEKVFGNIKKPILSDENLMEYGITNDNDLEFFHALNDLKRRIKSEYSDRPSISEIYYELLCDITGFLTVDSIETEEEIVRNLAAVIPPMSVYAEVMDEKNIWGAFWSVMRSIQGIDAYKPDEDAIQIMNIHKSKGKEFPVVILASLRDHLEWYDRGFPFKYEKDNEESVTYTPDEFLEYPRYEGNAKESHIQEEERVIYVGKTRAEDELILSSIVKDSTAPVKMALMRKSHEYVKSINNRPIRVKDVIDDNLDYCKLINPKEIDINLLKPEHKPPQEEVIQLSFTALENYNECPFRFKLVNQLGFSFSSKKEEIDDGIFIHSALEIINKKIKAESNARGMDKYEISDEEIREIVEQLFEKGNSEFKEKDPKNYYDKLGYITNDVIRYYNEIGKDLIIKDSEYSFYIRDKCVSSSDEADIIYSFSGKVDLIYEKDGKLGIIDYKNTDLVSGKYEEKYIRQLHYYVWALCDEDGKFDGKEIEEIQIYAIKYKDEDGNRGKLFPYDIDENRIKKLKKELEDVVKKIKKNEFEPICEDCSRCQFKKICKK